MDHYVKQDFLAVLHFPGRNVTFPGRSKKIVTPATFVTFLATFVTPGRENFFVT